MTEKAMQIQGDRNSYTFVVDTRADKKQIKRAIEGLFKVHVMKINTNVIRGKFKRVGKSIGKKSNIKKAMVTLKEGEKIEMFEGV